MRINKTFLTCCLILLSGCAVNNPNNIIDVTDDQIITDPHGKECKEQEMLIFPDRIEYFYPECKVNRIVRVKPHILPKPLKQKDDSPLLHDFPR